MAGVGASLPDDTGLSEWRVLAEAAVQSSIGERRIVVANCRVHSVGKHMVPDGELLVVTK